MVGVSVDMGGRDESDPFSIGKMRDGRRPRSNCSRSLFKTDNLQDNLCVCLLICGAFCVVQYICIECFECIYYLPKGAQKMQHN